MTEHQPPDEPPDFGFAPDIDPSKMKRTELAADDARARQKVAGSLAYAREIRDETRRNEALARASSAAGTLVQYEPFVSAALAHQAKAARAGKANELVHAQILEAARKLPECDRMRIITARFQGKPGAGERTIRRVLLAHGLLTPRRKVE